VRYEFGIVATFVAHEIFREDPMKKEPLALVGATLILVAAGCSRGLAPPPGTGDACRTSNGVCKIDIGVPAGCASGSCVTLSPDPVHVGDGTNTVRDVHLLWKLPHGYAFCSGDGVTFKGPTADQFSGNYATDDPNGGTGSGGATSPNYHWKDANTAKGPSGGFPYKVQFHDKTCATLFEKDPGVVNEM
jgi:hypothetical protein